MLIISPKYYDASKFGTYKYKVVMVIFKEIDINKDTVLKLEIKNAPRKLSPSTNIW